MASFSFKIKDFPLHVEAFTTFSVDAAATFKKRFHRLGPFREISYKNTSPFDFDTAISVFLF